MTDRAVVGRWLEAYEEAWRSPGTEKVAALFTADATYLKSPYEEPIVGIEGIRRMWEEERVGPDEVFTMSAEPVAVEGESAVVRVEVRYGDPVVHEYRDLWVLHLGPEGSCSFFEEWPFWPKKPYSAVAGGES